MTGFTLLWNKILRSSIWIQENKETRLVWITILALKDRDGNVHSSLIGLADSAKVTVEECTAALEILLAPDANDSSGVEEGRRIRAIQGGWQIVNNDLYRFSTESKREFWRQQQAEYRSLKKQGHSEIAGQQNGAPPALKPKARLSPTSQAIKDQFALKRVEERIRVLKGQTPFPEGDPRRKELPGLKTERERLMAALDLKA